MNWLNIVKIVLSLLPAIIAAIKAIEEVLPESNNGGQKLQLIRTIIESVSTEAAAAWPYIEKSVNALVAFFNSTGIFVSKPK
jgi:hypothetical protein